MSTMPIEQYDGLCQSLRKIDSKVKDEIQRQRRAAATYEQDNKHKPAYLRAKKGEALTEETKLKLISLDLQNILASHDVEASQRDCLKVVESASSHGRIVLVLETLVRGVWEQTDKTALDHEPDARNRANRADGKATYINVASLKMRDGHAARVSALVLSKDGNLLASADVVGAVLVWRLIEGEQVKLDGGTGRFVKLITSVFQDGPSSLAALRATGVVPGFKIISGTDVLAGVTADASLFVWDLDRDSLRLRISNARGDIITSVCICDPSSAESLQGLTITASEDQLIRLWDIRPMVDMHPKTLQFDVDHEVLSLSKTRLFLGMSHGDLVVLLHSIAALDAHGGVSADGTYSME
mmetsp:Transcript_4482/g.6604  ORF Transcript_4482/g.6604 Transcript_4482/m.6604 type:complete len:355 (+) Transcript_4482:611-1675(+)